LLEFRNCYILVHFGFGPQAMITSTALTMDVVKHTFSTIMILYSCSGVIFDVVEGYEL